MIFAINGVEGFFFLPLLKEPCFTGPFLIPATIAKEVLAYLHTL